MSSSGHQSNSNRDTAQHLGFSSMGSSEGAGTTNQSSSMDGSNGLGYEGLYDTSMSNNIGQSGMNTNNGIGTDIRESSGEDSSSSCREKHQRH